MPPPSVKYELRMLHSGNKIKVLEDFPWWVCVYVLIFIWSSKMDFLMYLFSLREIHLDQNSLFAQSLVYIGDYLRCHVFPGCAETKTRLSAVWIPSARDRPSPCSLRDDSSLRPGGRGDSCHWSLCALHTEGRPSAGPSSEALNENCHGGHWITCLWGSTFKRKWFWRKKCAWPVL